MKTPRTLDKRATAWISGLLFLIACFVIASMVDDHAAKGEENAISAPQETVAATSATREAATQGLRMLGVLGGLVIFELAILAPPSGEQEEERIKVGQLRRCPSCAEAVKSAAVVCRYCGRDLPTVEPTGPPSVPTPS